MTPRSTHSAGAWRACLAVRMALAGLFCLSSPATAQFGPFGRQPTMTDVFRPAPRALQQRISRARRAIEREDYAEAVELLGGILSGQVADPDATDVGQDFFIVKPGSAEKVRSSLRAMALRLLADLPAQGREFYELKFGSEARQLVKQAIADRDLNQLQEVARRFLHTEAGYNAAFLAGEWQLQHGHPLAAALTFKRLDDIPYARTRFEPTLSLLLATSYWQAGMTEQAVAVVRSLRDASQETPLVIAGKQVPWFAGSATEEVVAWLQSHLRVDARRGDLYQSEWVLFRGDPRRNGMAAGDFPLMHYRWRVRTVLLHKQTEFLETHRAKYRAAGRALIPMSQPLVVGDVVLMRTPERVLGVDLRTGKRIWDYPWFQDSFEFQSDHAAFESYGKTDSQRDELAQRLWEDAPYGQLSSDGERVYLLDEMEPAPGSFSAQNWFVPRRRGNGSDERRHNQLVACQLAEEGKLKWIVGGATGVDEPQLAGAFFLGPPLPLMGDLYVLAEVQGEIRLVVLDAPTGKLKWSQQVAHVAELTIDVDRTRRLSGAVPSFDDGVLVCPTAAGACVAIDLGTRSFLWGYQYPSTRFVRRYTPARRNMTDKWLDNTAVIADGCVILTPVDSNQLHCLDLLTGQLKWPPVLREKFLFVGGVYDGVIFVVGEDRCTGLRLEDGKPAWDEELVLGTSRPSGRGFLSGPFYYLPTTDRKLLKIDIRSGEVVQEATTDRPLGNLVAYRDQILSYDADQLGCYFQVDALRELVETRLKKNGDDHWALVHRAELYLHDGERAEALADLRRAHQLDPDDTMTRQVLVSTLMAALREDYKAHRALATEVVALIEHPEQRRQYLQLLIDGSIKEHAWGDALRSVRDLIALAAKPPVDGGIDSSRGPIEVAPGHEVDLHRWLAARIVAIRRGAPAEIGIQVEELVRGAFQRQRKAGDLAGMERVVIWAGPGAESASLRIEFAREILDRQGDLAAAELWISDLVDRRSTASRELIGAALSVQAEILFRAGHVDEMGPVLERLATEFSGVRLADGRTGGQVAEAWLKQVGDRLVPSSWPSGKLQVEEKKRSISRSVSRSNLQSYRLGLVQRQGHVPGGISVSYDVGARQLRVIDGWGKLLAFQQVRSYFNIVGSYPQQARARGHLVLAPTGFDLFMFRTLRSSDEDRGTLLWSDNVAPPLLAAQRTFRSLGSETVRGEWGGVRYRAIDRSNSQQPVGETGPITPYGVVYQRMQELVCVDPIRGGVLWKRTGFPAGAELAGDDEWLYVTPRNSRETTVVRMLDGATVAVHQSPPDVQRWRWLGRRLLRCAKEEQGLRLALWDVAEDEAVWEVTLPPETKLTLAGDGAVAALTPRGQLTVRSLDDGNVLVEAEVQRPPVFEGLYVLASAEDFLVVVNGSITSVGNVTYEKLPMRNGALIYGYLYSFDRRTGKPRWRKPAAVGGFSLSFDQPSELPILVFMRRARNRSAVRAASRSNQFSIMCLDRRNGSQALAERKVTRAPTTFEISGDRRGCEVALRLQQYEFVFRLTSAPYAEPPEPLQMKLKAELKMSATLEGLSRIAGELFKNVEGKKPKADKSKKRDPFGEPEAKPRQEKEAKQGPDTPPDGKDALPPDKR